MDRNEFELFIAEVLDNIPAKFQDRAENLIIEIDETEIPVSKSTGKEFPASNHTRIISWSAHNKEGRREADFS